MASGNAEPTTGSRRVVAVRPYHNNAGGTGAGLVYVTVNQATVCNTDTYQIDLNWGGAKESVAAAMAALISEKPVQIEIVNTGCATPAWTTGIQSLYLLN